MIPFSKPYLVGREHKYLAQAMESGKLKGDGPFSGFCQKWLEDNIGCLKAMLMPSCTAALEMTALLIGTQPGDEIIMPSYTFVSTANAFVLRGGIPVFVDILPEGLSMNADKIEAAITSKTKAIVQVHYAGMSGQMDVVMSIAKKYDLFVIEDAAQSIMASYKERAFGSFGHFGCLSFHDTKNIIAGEGGALLINDERFIERAEIIREKGTNRSNFIRGRVDKYTWVDKGSSYLPSELMAAFLFAQLEKADQITEMRLNIWKRYHEALSDMEEKGAIKRMVVPDGCKNNGHMFYLLFNESVQRNFFIDAMKKAEVYCTFHYIALHSTEMGKKHCKVVGEMRNTESLSARLVRLPLYAGMTDQELDHVLEYTISSIEDIVLSTSVLV